MLHANFSSRPDQCRSTPRRGLERFRSRVHHDGGWGFFGGSTPEGAFDITPGFPFTIRWGENFDDGFFMSVTMNGATYSTGDASPGTLNGREGIGSFSTSPIIIAGAGVYTAPFQLDASLSADGCLTTCNNIDVSGTGIATMNIVREQSNIPGLFFMPSATFTFKSAPEPVRSRCSPLALSAWPRGASRSFHKRYGASALSGVSECLLLT
jgi:hypothetical protein